MKELIGWLDRVTANALLLCSHAVNIPRGKAAINA
jgi:hypothetical protein